MKHRTLAAVGVFVVSLMLSLSASAGPAQGRGPDKVKPAKQSKPVKDVKPAPAKPVHEVKPDKPKPVKPVPLFGPHERDVITVYYTKHPGKHGKLPPGLEKQLQRNGTLPPGLRARFRPFPLALERELGPLPYGYRRGFVDDYVVVYRNGTYLITDSYWYQLR